MTKHILQSPVWAEFKNAYGTPAIETAGVVYTKHEIPFTGNYYAYSPRVDPAHVNFDALKKSLEENSCININFDVPNIIKGSENELAAYKIFSASCVRAPRDQFAKGNMLMDLTLGEDDLMANMHTKHRYNTRLAEKKGVTIRIADHTSEEDFRNFFKMYEITGKRQRFYYRSYNYLKTLWDIFKKNGHAEILLAEYQGKVLAAWMLFFYDNVMYYPYGGSSDEFKNLQASCLLGWEVLKFGKQKGVTLFDMWGAAYDPLDEKDSYHGFTQFKERFGAKHVQYIDSYDFVENPKLYTAFNMANILRWKVLNFLR